jgi:5-methylcytosine-specific restriction endonuclease McrA
LIAPRLEEHPALLEKIVGKRKREVEELVASLGVPKEIPDRMRPLAPALPARREESLFFAPTPREAASTARSPAPEPAPEPRMEFRFAAGPRFVEVVARLRALLWHKHPAGRLEDLLYEAASDFLARRNPARPPQRAARRNQPSRRRRSRRIPAAVRRAVWRRDGGRCSFSGPAGRCGESRGLELDHVEPWALGGRSDEASNLRLLCRAHNQSEAIRIFGKRESTRVDSGG